MNGNPKKMSKHFRLFSHVIIYYVSLGPWRLPVLRHSTYLCNISAAHGTKGSFSALLFTSSGNDGPLAFLHVNVVDTCNCLSGEWTVLLGSMSITAYQKTKSRSTL